MTIRQNMKKNDKVSIVVPVYNAEDTIERCIDSILGQTYLNWELLIINDGSFDKTGSIIKKYSDSRIYIYNQNNLGAARARNKGLELCKGNYVAFIDADDWIENDYLEMLLINIKKKKSDIVISDVLRHDGVQSSIMGIIDNKSSNISIKNCCKLILQRTFPIGVWGKMFRTNFLRENKVCFSEYRFCEDLLFCFSCLQYNPAVYYCDFAKYHIVNNKQSVCNVYSDEHMKIYDVLEEIKKIMVKLNCFYELEDDYITYYLYMVKNMVDYGIRFEKLRYTFSVVKRCPYKTSLLNTEKKRGKDYINKKLFETNIYIYTFLFFVFYFIKRRVTDSN